MADYTREQLEERVAYAEQARDNAIAMRDEVQARSKKNSQRTGAMINSLKLLVLSLCETQTKLDYATQKMAEILKDPVKEKTS